MPVQYKTAAFELKREPDEDGSFEGYASVFNVIDDGMDVVAEGAFTKSLAERKVKMLWQHDQHQPIGVWDEIAEDDRGLRVKGRLLKDVQKGREAMALLRAGAIDSMSIGYATKAATEEGSGTVRRLLEVDLYEVSLVTFPMLRDAVVTDLKSIKTIREFERALRDAGFSQNEAKAVAANGFEGLRSHRDDGSERDNEAMSGLISQLGNLKEKINA